MKNTTEKITKILEIILVTIFVILVIDVLWQVFARYFIGKSSSFTEELSRYLLIWLAILGTAYSRSYKGQMAIDFVFEKLNPKNQFRVSLFIEACIVAFAFFIMILGGINLVYITLKLDQTSPALHLPMGVVYSIVPISGLLILFFSANHISDYIKNRNQLNTSKN